MYDVDFSDKKDIDNIEVLLPVFQKIINEYKRKYEKIIIESQIDQDGYKNLTCIVGVRLENDEEYNKRIEKIQFKEEQEEKAKLEKKEKARLKKIEQAKKILETLSA